VGRLDYNSTDFTLTNDGELARRLTHPIKREEVYQVG
jgi:16S rRNA U516 pseudouridylate synthase RsuA-like enzyme